MNYRWVYAVLWLALIAGFVYLRNRMNMGGLRPAPPAAAEAAPRLWSVPPLVMLPSDTMKPEYAAAHFSGSAYRAWMSYNNTLTRDTATSSGSSNPVALALADSLSSAAHVALDRLQIRLPPPALAEFQSATVRMDSIVARANGSFGQATLTELHNQTFELLRQLTALK